MDMNYSDLTHTAQSELSFVLDEIVKDNEFKPQILAKYPLTKGITHQKLRKLISEAIELIKQDKIEVTDLLPEHNFSNLNKSIIDVLISIGVVE